MTKQNNNNAESLCTFVFRQELIALLKKAKAHSGAAGFKGMQIPDVVKCVEDIVETEVFSVMILLYIQKLVLALFLFLVFIHDA